MLFYAFFFTFPARAPGSIPIKVAVLYVAEVLVLRYILDDKPGSTAAQERTTEALAVKLL